MKNGIVGILLGLEEFVNMMLEDISEFEAIAEGRGITILDQILLSGNNTTILVLGGLKYEWISLTYARLCFFLKPLMFRFYKHKFLLEQNTGYLGVCFVYFLKD